MRLIFMGTPEFAVPSLEVCLEDHEVVGVFTQPDRPKGRGHKAQPSAVKIRAQRAGVTVYQPLRLKKEDNIKKIKALAPDAIVVVAYGQILSQEILDLAPKGCINVHGSLLPAYRGPAPIHWALIRGEKTTGVSTMYMDKGLDTGDVIETASVSIHPEMTTGRLHDILKGKGAELLRSTLRKIENSEAVRTKQDEEKSSYAPLLEKKDGLIQWDQSALDIVNRIRGLNPWPCAAGFLGEKRVKFYEAKVGETGRFGEPGEILATSKDGVLVQGGDGIVILSVFQFPNEKKLHVSQYLLGHDLPCGQVFRTCK